MQGIIVPVMPFAQNCSRPWCKEKMKGVPLDPGVEIERILIIPEP